MTARLTALDPNNPRWKRERMESLNLAAMALQYSNKQQGAISAYQKAGNLARSELKKDPGNATLQRFLSICSTTWREMKERLANFPKRWIRYKTRSA